MNLKAIFRKKFPKGDLPDFHGFHIPAHYVRKAIVPEQSGQAIVIGDQFGSDYRLIKPLFDDVKAIDVVDNGVIPAEDLVLQDASQRTSFADESVDFVVARNVIEHMFGDYDCICEMNRVLKPGARFFIDVPFLSDDPYFHFRVFTPKIFDRMMEQAGFKLLERRYRGVASKVSNNFVAAAALALYPLFGRDAIRHVNRTMVGLNRLFDRSYSINKLAPSRRGGFMTYEKVGAPVPEVEVQISHFGVPRPE